VFKQVPGQGLYRIKIEEATEKWICRVTRIGKGHSERTCFFLKEFEQLAFGDCSCGLPCTRYHKYARVGVKLA